MQRHRELWIDFANRTRDASGQAARRSVPGSYVQVDRSNSKFPQIVELSERHIERGWHRVSERRVHCIADDTDDLDRTKSPGRARIQCDGQSDRTVAWRELPRDGVIDDGDARRARSIASRQIAHRP